MRVKYEYAGNTVTKSGLLVHFEVVTGSVRRVKTLKMPWSDLTDRECLEIIANEVSKGLVERWKTANDEAQPYLPWD